MPTQQEIEAKKAEQAEQAKQAAIDAAVAEALDKQRKEYEAERAAQASEGNTAAGPAVEDTSEYELLADSLNVVVPGKGTAFTYVEYVKGDPVPLTAIRARELIAAGAVADPDAAEPETVGAETQAPSRRRRS